MVKNIKNVIDFIEVYTSIARQAESGCNNPYYVESYNDKDIVVYTHEYKKPNETLYELQFLGRNTQYYYNIAIGKNGTFEVTKKVTHDKY